MKLVANILETKIARIDINDYIWLLGQNKSQMTKYLMSQENRRNFMKPGVGVGIMILKGNEILLGLRNPNKEKASSELNGQGTWTMPGGKVKFMEKLVDAAKRELKEETNLEAVDLELISISDDMTDVAHYVTAGFLVTEIIGELKTMEPETILEWKWFNINELPKNIYLPSKKVVEKYLDGKIYE